MAGGAKVTSQQICIVNELDDVELHGLFKLHFSSNLKATDESGLEDQIEIAQLLQGASIEDILALIVTDARAMQIS
jgi:hypothetical protein